MKKGKEITTHLLAIDSAAYDIIRCAEELEKNGQFGLYFTLDKCAGKINSEIVELMSLLEIIDKGK